MPTKCWSDQLDITWTFPKSVEVDNRKIFRKLISIFLTNMRFKWVATEKHQ